MRIGSLNFTVITPFTDTSLILNLRPGSLSCLFLTSDGFVDIDKETLKLILSRETLNCRETVIFDAARRWAQAECVRNDIQNENNEEN